MADRAPTRSPRWMTGLEVYEPLDPGPLVVGSRIRQELSVSGQHLKFELEVARWSRRRPRSCASRAPASRRPTSTRSRRDGGGAAVTLGDLGRHDLVQGQADRADGAGQAGGEARHRPRRGCARCSGLMPRGARPPRRARSLLLRARAGRAAGELIDRAASGSSSDNVYVDPDADPTLTDDRRGAARPDPASGAGPMYVAVVPAAIAREAGGSDPGAGQIARAAVGRARHLRLVAGRSIRARLGPARRGRQPASSSTPRSTRTAAT